jgi:hypothetical protein
VLCRLVSLALSSKHGTRLVSLPVTQAQVEDPVQLVSTFGQLLIFLGFWVKFVLIGSSAKVLITSAVALFIRLDCKGSEVLACDIEAWDGPGFKAMALIAAN